jgi:hypothetical protein
MRIRLLILTALSLLVGCEIPVSPLPNVGDEMRLTNDAWPNYGPFEYSNIDTSTLDYGIIGYHDTESIYLFDLSTMESSVVYTVEDGWVITALSRIENLEESYCFSVTDGEDVILYASLSGDVQIVYEFNGLLIDGIDCIEEGSNYLYILIVIDKQIFYIRYDYTLEASDIDMYLDEGYDVWIDSMLVGFYYIKEVDNFEQIYYGFIASDGSYFESVLLDHPEFAESNERYPGYGMSLFSTSDVEGQVDIWHIPLASKLTDSVEVEADLYYFSDFILFNRTVGGQNDLYILRATDIPDF